MKTKQRKTHIYFHKPSGNIMQATEKEAKKLGKDWECIQFTTNEKGERVMRFQFDGATVDVQQRGTEVVENGQPVSN